MKSSRNQIINSIPENYIEVTTVETIQLLLYQLFHEFHDLCEKNHIFYNAFAGTLLGAVRHGGMIPWDDDIDVGIPRPDYDRFIELVQNINSNRYELYVYPREGYVYPFAKFCFKDTVLIENLKPKYCRIKLYIDVFPIDGYPTEDEKQYFKRFTWLKKRLCQCVYPVTASKNILKKLYFPIKWLKSSYYSIRGVDYYLKEEDKLAHKYSYTDSEYILCMGDGWRQKGKLLKTTYENRQLFPFGNGFAWGLKEYDEHLTRLYGDYMTPPPKEKQASHHNYRLFINKTFLKEFTT